MKPHKYIPILLILIFAGNFSALAQTQIIEHKETTRKATIDRTASISTGISLPTGDFANTSTEIGPFGNANPGFYVAGSVDLSWKFFGWKFEANATFNPVATNLLLITENSTDTETGTWMNTKLLTGPQIKYPIGQLELAFGGMFGGMWLYYPAFKIGSEDQSSVTKIQNIPTLNFAQHYHASLGFPLSDKLTLKISVNYEYTNAKAKYLRYDEMYQLGNAFSQEYGYGSPHRINNELPPGEIYTGWIGSGTAEYSIKQKVSEIKLGILIQYKL